ncbi:hypothetical protein MMYC01_209177 [Madurella mycetomatis]|uniref:Hydroxyacyl-thioester dehydratase type 2, mitochondrial n=1 Tax=Madurella mycetomatis TaxID=100816 RepID=A0A175VUW8_9PEZI|nr:hypothetical protein MMYC01_209177 [Madurella mycetomatis]
MRSSLARLRPPTNHSHPPHILLGASYRPKSTTTTTTTTTTNAPFSPPPPQSPSFSPSAYLEAAARKFASTPPILTRDVLSPTPSRLLTLSLADHCPALFPPLPPSHDGGSSNNDKGDGNGNADLPSFPMLPQGHHLVYFPLQRPPSQLMPDGTDPAHSPGPPFVRRMWAGGEVVFRGGWERELRVDGRPVGCLERVGGRPVFKEGKGKGDGEGKVFVEVRREYGVLRDGGGGLGGETGGVIEEVRRLVFLRERGGHRAGERKVAEEGRKGVRGYKGLLVHGPLSLVLMLAALRASLVQLQTASVAGNPLRMPYVKLIRYSNLAPLYVDEEMKVCLRRTRPEGDELGWDVWIEGPEGGLAVKGTAVTTGVR